MTVWTNDDGLKVAFGNEQGKRALGGEVNAGTHRTLELEIDHSRLPASSASDTILSVLDDYHLPQGAIILSATLDVTEGFTSGGAATLTMGLAESDGTEIDFDGLDASVGLTDINSVGERLQMNGALIQGAALTAKGFITANVGTADYTAGRANLLIEYHMPASF